jgi:hypothetical protein
MQANDLLFCANSALNRRGRVGSAPKDPAPHFVKNAMPSYRNGSQFANFVIGDAGAVSRISSSHARRQAVGSRSQVLGMTTQPMPKSHGRGKCVRGLHF